MREPNEEVPDGTVLEEFRKGFALGDKLLRPAMVKVSFRETPEPVATAADDAEEPEAAAPAEAAPAEATAGGSE